MNVSISPILLLAGVNLRQLAVEHSNVTGKSLNLPAAKFNSLYFCPASADQDRAIEMRKLDEDQSYTSITMQTTTPIRQIDAYRATS